MNNNILKLGVVNFHTYLQDEITLNGNAIAFRADNGVGKTALMTALYPTFLTMDLHNSLNFGGKVDRKPIHFVKEQTYIYSVIKRQDGENWMLLISFRKKSEGKIDSQAVVFKTDTLQFFDGDDIIHLPQLKSNNKDFIYKSFNTKSEYKRWVAKELFGIELTKFESKLRIENKIAKPSINMNDKKYHVDELINEIKNGFVSITDIEGISQNIRNYAQSIYDYNQQKVELDIKTDILTYLAKERHKLSHTNQNALDNADKTRRKMNTDLNNLEEEISNLDQDLDSLEEQIEQNSKDLKDNELSKSDLEYQLKRIEMELSNHDLKTVIQQKEFELNQLNKSIATNQSNLSSVERDLQRAHTNKNNTEDTIINLQNELHNLVEPLPLPFDVADWDSIKSQAKEYQDSLNKQNSLKQNLETSQQKEHDLTNDITKLNEDLTVKKLQFDQELETYFLSTKEQPFVNESLNDYQSRLLDKTNLQKAQNQQEILAQKNILTEAQIELKSLQNSDKIKNHFKATNAKPLYEVIDFKDFVSEDDKNKIESYLRDSGLLELIISADDIKKGYYI